MKLHTGDSVLVISGKDRGKTGTILRVLPIEQRVIVSGVNIRTRHVRKTVQQAGRIIRYEASLSASNVMILDPKTKKPSRIGFKLDEKGRKIRISKVSGEEVRTVKPETVKKKGTKGTEGTEVKKEAKESKEPTVSTTKKTPFWKRMGFGKIAEEAEVKEAPHMKEDQSIPEQHMHARTTGRGS